MKKQSTWEQNIKAQQKAGSVGRKHNKLLEKEEKARARAAKKAEKQELRLERAAKKETWEKNVRSSLKEGSAVRQHNRLISKERKAEAQRISAMKKEAKAAAKQQKLLQKNSTWEENMEVVNPRKKPVWKTVLVVVLAVALLGESIALIVTGIKKDTPAATVPQDSNITLNLSLGEVSSDIGSAVSALLSDFTEGSFSTADIVNTLKGVIYSDSIVNTIMSMAYPLLFEVLTNLNMMEFAPNIDLYATPVLYAGKIPDTSYTCCDKDGTRKPLTEVLKAADGDWSYMDAEVTRTDTDGKTKTTTLWNSINWGVSDKASFYKAMNAMSEGLRGVLEICVQGKEKPVNINIIEFLLKKDFMNINLEAATIYNASEKSGYEICLVRLFNALGLKDGEYPSVEVACSYTGLGDIWQAILEPVLFAVEKAANDPVNALPSMLVNFADIIETGELVKSMQSLRIDATFHPLATAFMGFESGLLHNLGDSLVKIICEMGIDISGSFNKLLDGLLALITKNESADMPDMDINALRSCAAKTTLSNGNSYYVADSQKTIDFLISYAIDEKIVESVIALTPLAGTEDAQTIISAVGQSKEGITNIAKVLVNIVLKKLNEIL
ncbi:MAG: hypothetical protein IJE93_04355 [Clostridia bacterium]|nr:hypothetical protein [Clostridia bacterium]